MILVSSTLRSDCVPEEPRDRDETTSVDISITAEVRRCVGKEMRESARLSRATCARHYVISGGTGNIPEARSRRPYGGVIYAPSGI